MTEDTDLLWILTIKFAFQSQNFSRHLWKLACKAQSAYKADEDVSHKIFPECLGPFLRLLCHLLERQTHRFFSYNFSLDCVKQPDKLRRFSHKTFLANDKKDVFTILAHKKCDKCQIGKDMRENSPFLQLNVHNAVKSFLRTAKNILRIVTYASS